MEYKEPFNSILESFVTAIVLLLILQNIDLIYFKSAQLTILFYKTINQKKHPLHLIITLFIEYYNLFELST